MAALGVPITHGDIPRDSSNKYASAESGETAANEKESNGLLSTVEPGPCKPKKGMNVKDVLKNPALAKLLVTAARKLKEKEKEEFAAANLVNKSS